MQRGDRGFETVRADPRGLARTRIRADIRGEDRGPRISAESDNFTYNTELIINKKNEVLDQVYQVGICNYVLLKWYRTVLVDEIC